MDKLIISFVIVSHQKHHFKQPLIYLAELQLSSILKMYSSILIKLILVMVQQKHQELQIRDYILLMTLMVLLVIHFLMSNLSLARMEL